MRQSKQEKTKIHETVRKNAIEQIKKRLVQHEFKVSEIQRNLLEAMRERDLDQKLLVDIFERGITALISPTPKTESKGIAE